jgi:hypothetical protein
MSSPDEPRIVPVYAITRGRTRSVGRDLPLETLVRATANGTTALHRLQFEPARIVALCRTPNSVAEVAAHVGLPVGVARVLVSDLHADGMLTITLPVLNDGGRPRVDILERLLTGLKAQA